MNSNVQKMNNKIISKTPIGSVCVIWSVSKNHPLISRIFLSRPGMLAEKMALRFFPDLREISCAEIDATADSIRAYLEGEDVTFSLRFVDLSRFSKFQQSVLRAQFAIPRGVVSTYGLIAKHVGAFGGARAVGRVMAVNPFPLMVPCHRTVLSDLRLGGFQSGTAMKRFLLEMEGISFDETGRIVRGPLHYA